MKKKLILAASLFTTFCLSLSSLSLADERNNPNQSTNVLGSSTQHSTTLESTTATNTTSSPLPIKTATSTSESSATTPTTTSSTTETIIRSLAGQDESSYGEFTKGTPVTAEEFKPLIEKIEQIKLRAITFYKEAPTMDQAGLTKADFLIVTEQGETIKYTYTFLTKNNKATIKLTDIKFDTDRHLLSFKTDPSCVAYITADTDKGATEIYTHGTGIVARQYDHRPTKIQIIVLDLKGNYSDVIHFDVLANDVYKNETETEKLTILQNKAEKVKNDRDKLPQTSEQLARNGLLGASFILVSLGFILDKRRK